MTSIELSIYIIARSHKLSKNLGVTSKYQEPEGNKLQFQRTRNFGVTCEPVIWRFLIGTCELVHIFGT